MIRENFAISRIKWINVSLLQAYTKRMGNGDTKIDENIEIDEKSETEMIHRKDKDGNDDMVVVHDYKRVSILSKYYDHIV